jgi:hypothetical protein
MASWAAADSTGPASMEEAKSSYVASSHTDVDPIEAKSSYVASSHTDVDPFNDSYLLERLIDSVWLTDNNTQRMIASA